MADVESLVAEFRAVAEPIPAIKHPWFQGIINGEFTTEQLVEGEKQHYLRGLYGNARIFGTIAIHAIEEGDEDIVAVAIPNLAEEICGSKTHADLMYQFLEEQGVSKVEAAKTRAMPGTKTAIATMSHGVEDYSAIEGIAMMALPEDQNGGPDGTAAAVHKALKEMGFSDYAIETYKVHAVADEGHGDSQLDLLARKVIQKPEIKPAILRALHRGMHAFNLEWDGHVQAATGDEHFRWSGVI